VTILGGSLPAVRVELNPQQLSHYGLGLQDVASVISTQNANRPKGQISDENTIADITANDQISKARDYAPLVIGSKDHSVVRLSDVAMITDSVENVRSVAYVTARSQSACSSIAHLEPTSSVPSMRSSASCRPFGLPSHRTSSSSLRATLHHNPRVRKGRGRSIAAVHWLGGLRRLPLPA